MNNSTTDNETFTMNTPHSDPTWSLPDFDASAKNIILAIILIVLDLVTMFGNGLVLLAFAMNRHLLQPFNMFILNLAVTDFLVAITAMTFYTIDTLLGYWPFGYAMCCVWIYFDFAMTFASVFTLVAISVDRFWCVTWAVHYKVHNSRTKTGIILGVVWACVLLLWTPPFVSDRLKQTESNFCIWEPSENHEFVIIVALIGHYLPCFIMVFCYLKVLYVMRRQSTLVATHHTRSLQADSQPGTSQARSNYSSNSSHSRSNPVPAKNNPVTISNRVQTTDENCFTSRPPVSSDVAVRRNQLGSGRRTSAGEAPRNSTNYHTRDRKIFMTLTYVLGSYLICWFPFYIVFDTYAWRPELVPNQLYTFFFWMTYVNSVLNPIIYAYTSKEFRSAFKKTLKCLCPC